MQFQLRHKFTATPQGIFLDGEPLNKSTVSTLPARSLYHIACACEIMLKMTDKDWEPPAPHGPNDIPKRAQVEMHLALANPGSFNKGYPDQPRDDKGRWTGGKGALTTDAVGGMRAHANASEHHIETVPASSKNPKNHVHNLVATYLPGLGNTYLDSRMIEPVKNFISNVASMGVTITFSSAFRTTANQRALNNSNSTTPAPAGTSLHEAGYAVDVNWSQIPENQRQNVVDAAEKAGLLWGGDFNNPDPVHFYMNPEGDRASAIQHAQNRYKIVTGANSTGTNE